MDEADVRQAANELQAEITSKVGQLTDRLTGRSPEWAGLASQDRERWPELSRWYLTAIRIADRAEVDPTGWALNARRFGATWEAIGKACGVTRQAAYDRWGKYSDYEGTEGTEVDK